MRVVNFAPERIAREEVSLETLAQAYLAVLAVATQQAPIPGPAEKIRVYRSFRQYRTSVDALRWGTQEYGLDLEPRKYETRFKYGERTRQTVWQDSQMGGWSGDWYFLLPKSTDFYIKGSHSLDKLALSSATLSVTGPEELEAALGAAFEAALSPWDQRLEPDGPARILLEQILLRLQYRMPSSLDIECDDWPPALRACAQFLGALVNQVEPADYLEGQWAYGIVCHYDQQGLPKSAQWWDADQFPPSSAEAQINLLKAATARQRGDLSQTRQLLERVIASPCALAKNEAIAAFEAWL